MLHDLLTPLSDGGDIFNLFRYITFRAGGAFFTSLILCFLFGRPLIDWLRKKQKKGQPIRDDGPQRHIVEKAGTPTMGGVMILGALMVSSILWARWDNGFVVAVLLVTLAFGLIGFADDFMKVTKFNTKGVSGRLRLGIGFVVSGLAGWYMSTIQPEGLRDAVAVPVLKDTLIHIGWLYIPFAICVIAGSANAVNMTDGLDGLAIMPVMIAAASLGIICYLVGNTVYTTYLGVHYVPGTGEIVVISAAIIGAGLGFLWYNAPPAMVFMGDTGSLALGGGLGAMAIAAKHEIVWAVIGGLFVLEAVSVFVQVASFKMTGKRVFRMAPIHHHFEQKGWKEPTIVIRFWIIALILAMIGLASLKLR